MDIGVFRDSINKRLQTVADNATTAALNLQPRQASDTTPATTTDEYALTQVNQLATARATLAAIRVVESEYLRLTTPEKTQEPEAAAKKTKTVY